MLQSFYGGVNAISSCVRLLFPVSLLILMLGLQLGMVCCDKKDNYQAHHRIQLTRTRVLKAINTNKDANERKILSCSVAYHPHRSQLAAATIATLREDANGQNKGQLEIFRWNTQTWELDGVANVGVVANNSSRSMGWQLGIAFNDYHEVDEDELWLVATIANDQNGEPVVRISSTTNATSWDEERVLPFPSTSNTNHSSTTISASSKNPTPSLAWHPRGGYLAASAYVGWNSTVMIWNRATWKALPTSRLNNDDKRTNSSESFAVAWSRPDGAYLLINERSPPSIYTLDALFTPVDLSDILLPTSSKNQHSKNNPSMYNVASVVQIRWKPDGSTIAMADVKGSVFVVQHNDDIESNNENMDLVVPLPLPRASLSQEQVNVGSSVVISLEWSPPNGAYLMAVVMDKDSQRRTHLLLWQSSDWSQLPYELVLLNDDTATLPLLPPSVAWSPDGQQLAVAQNDGSGEIKIWEVSEVVVEEEDKSGNDHEEGFTELWVIFILCGSMVVLALAAFLVVLRMRLRMVRRRKTRTQSPFSRSFSSCSSRQGSACGSGKTTAKSLSPTQPPIGELSFPLPDGTANMNSQKRKSIKGFVSGEEGAAIELFECSDDGEVVDYNDYNWKELPKSVQKAAEVLGYNQNMWDRETESPACESKSWRRLTQAERDAATAIGYNQAKWDAD